ncbi:ABC transporter substrate-binding protein [Paenibacillus sp. y28]|uniref:ABC transporter substrate-binding protein n=1 Tax=Paenibacillus sp. y28 TaxID=3129110 RepID=UPI003015E286
MKKNLVAIITLLCLLVISACGQPAAPQAAQSPAAAPGGEAAGQAKAPSKEKRIASMSIHLTNNLLAVGVTPVGSVIGGDLKDFLPHVKDRLQNTKKLGVVTDPDMEALLALKPDVIYLDKKYSGQDQAKFEQIAPVEVFDLDEGTWRDHVKKVGKLVGREKEADDMVKSYDEQTQRVKGMIQGKLGADSKVMAIRVTAKELRVFGMVRPMGPILFEDLKLKPANGVEKINKAYEVISQEVLPDFDADAIFVIVNREEGAQKVFDQLKTNPVWLGLKAVKQNHVYPIADQPWLDYSSLGNKMAMDAAEQMFSK